MNTRLKKILKFSAYSFLGLFSLFLLAAVAIPFLFKDKILEQAKVYINEQVNAQVEFQDLNLSLFKGFPYISAELVGLDIRGKDAFDGMQLAKIQSFALYINPWSLLKGDYTVSSIAVDEAKFYVKVLKNGQANYDIMKPSEDTTSTSPESNESSNFQVKLSSYSISNTDIVYDDASMALHLEIQKLNHEGSGNFSASQFQLYTNTTIEALSLSYALVPYFNRNRIEAQLNFDIDLDAFRIKLLDNQLKINALQLLAEGEFAMPNEDIDMDLKLSAPSAAFSQVLSLVPGAYSKSFAGVQTEGNFQLAAFAKGKYSETSLPSFGLDLKVQNASFQYPDLPLGMKNIAADLSIQSPSANLDEMKIDLAFLRFLLGSNPFEAKFALRRPLSDPDINADLKGKIDLEEIAKAFPMEEVQKLNGLIESDLHCKTKLSFIEKEDYERVEMQGKLRVQNMNYEASGSPKVEIKNFDTEFSPNHVLLNDLDLKMGRSDLRAKGKLDNLLSYFSPKKVMEGNLLIESTLLDLNELLGEEETGKEGAPTATNMTDTSSTASKSNEQVFDRFRFSAEAKMQTIIYDVYELRKLESKGSISPELAQLEQLDFSIGKVDMRMKGYFENIFAYLFGKGLLKGDFSFESNYFNLNQFMTSDGSAPEPSEPREETAEAAYEPIEIPNNIEFHAKAKIKTLIYEHYRLRNMQAELLVKEQKLIINELKADALGGVIALHGEYNTQNPKKPGFRFGYDMSNLDFEESFKQLASIRKFFPIMRSIQGRFNSNFSISGLFDEQFSPVLSSLNAEGAIVTTEAILKGFSVLTKLSKETRIKDLENLVLKGTKNYFKIENGKVELAPFDYDFQGIAMNFSGSHALEGQGDYSLRMRVPKSKLTSTALGQAANQATNTGLSLLQGQASKLGVNLENPEVEAVNMAVGITGSISQPKFSVKLLGAESRGGKAIGQQAQDAAKAEAERLRAEAEARAKEAEEKLRAEADRLKEEVEAKAREAEDKLRSEAEKRKAEAEARARAEAQRLKEEAERKAKEEAERRLRENEALQRAKDSAQNAIRNRLPNNPFDRGGR